MSAPGAGEGVSWVDVAASAAGIYRQMEEIGRQAAAGFTNSFNSAVAAPMSAALSASMGAAVRSAGAQISGMQTALSAAFGGAGAGEAGVSDFLVVAAGRLAYAAGQLGRR
jgi:hypothetical protein